MEAGIVGELRTCRVEKDLLKQKLHSQLHRWTLDKIMFEEITAKATQEHCLKEVEQCYNLAQWDLRFGSQQQQLLVLKLKLDSALEDKELKEIQFSALKAQLQEERNWLHAAKEKMQDLKGAFSKKVASERSKLITETESKIRNLQRSLDHREQSHRAEVEQLKGKHAVAVSQMEDEIKRLVSRRDGMKAQLKQKSPDRKQVHELSQDIDDLRVEQEQWYKDKNALLQDAENLRGKLEKWELQMKEIEEITDERDNLIAENNRCISRDKEMQELLQERDRLNAQLVSQEDDILQLVSERDQLKHELDLSNTQRQQEVEVLVRGRDFVRSQMKKLDEDYQKQSKKMSEQNLQDTVEIERLKNEINGEQVVKNELMLEMTILKLEVRRAEDLATQRQCAFEAELQELQSRLEKEKEENQTLFADVMTKDSRLLELTSQIDTLKKQLCSPFRGQDPEAVGGDGVKERPEVFNAGDGLSLDHEILESQLEEAAQNQTQDERKSFKSTEDLRRENKNLRREVGNLKVLYAEVEDVLRRKDQKPAKVASKVIHRDPTSRNLNLELEAAATCCSSEESPLVNGNIWEKGQKRIPANKKVFRINLTEKKSKDALSHEDDSHSAEHVEVSKKIRGSKGTSAHSKCRSDENVVISSPRNLRRRSRVDYSDSKVPLWDTTVDKSDHEVVKKSRRKVDNLDFPLNKHQRPPLHTLAHNQTGTSKSAVRLSSSSGPLPGSPTKTSKLMANLFSTAFSVPRLKSG